LTPKAIRNKSIQATLWCIRKEWLVSVEDKEKDCAWAFFYFLQIISWVYIDFLQIICSDMILCVSLQTNQVRCFACQTVDETLGGWLEMGM
jgi:hypothetical protein